MGPTETVVSAPLTPEIERLLTPRPRATPWDAARLAGTTVTTDKRALTEMLAEAVRNTAKLPKGTDDAAD